MYSAEVFCQVCAKTFQSVDELDFHTHLYHEHECQSCKKHFTTLKHLEIHNLERHDTLYQLRLAKNESQYECIDEACNKQFNTQRDRFNHLISDHNYSKLDLTNDEQMDMHIVDQLFKKQVPNKISFGEDVEIGFEIKEKKIAKRRLK